MDGPEILARSMSASRIADKFGNYWQYHSRSDSHSKLACWALLFDLLQHCPLLIKHVRDGKVGFGINHEMFDFRTRRKKNLDLVICTIGTDDGRRHPSFVDQARLLNVDLTSAQRKTLPLLPTVQKVPVGSVFVAIEAKACMTEHGKALPRLYDELNSSHLAIHGSSDFAIAAGFAVVNVASRFVSSDRNRWSLGDHIAVVNEHRQPDAAQKTIDKLEEIPRRTTPNTDGFDALGIVGLHIVNDGSPVHVSSEPPAPRPQDPFHYDQMVRRIVSSYADKFGNQ